MMRSVPTIVGTRKTVVLFFGATLLTISAAVIISRFVLNRVSRLEAEPAVRWQEHRLTEMIQAIPKIAASEVPVMICLGASITEFAFEPRRFDDAEAGWGIHIRSYNLGLRNLHHQLPFIVGRIQAEFAARNARPRLILLTLTPEILTDKANKSPKFRRLDREMNAQLYDPRGPNLDLLRSDPSEFLSVLATRYLLQGFSSENTFWELKYAFLRKMHYDKYDSENAAAEVALLAKFWEDPRLFEEPAWDLSTRGFTAKGYAGHDDWWFRDTTAADRRAFMQISVRYHNLVGDLAGMHLYPTAVEEFVSLTEMAQRTADHVAILYLPEHDALHRNREARARLDGLIRYLKSRTSAEFLDYSKGHLFSDDDYFDVVHLNRSGRKKLTRLLVRDLTPILADRK